MRFLILLFLLLNTNVLMAVDKNPIIFDDSGKEQRFIELIAELRCVVCQNQSLADSNAELAQDLRDEVRTMMLRGDTDQQIKDFLVVRYGDYVLYRPPVNEKTYLLWLGPGILLLLAIILMFFFIYRHNRNSATSQKTALSHDEQARLNTLLKDDINH